ncbi:DNA dC-_dU-editing enzyme APOBEC-3G-like [Phyllostomus hastatus]|uniref:DNA dC->dU-editing enzyme APOBEC-3G-like n=1 Tax=Phyllostomus hastatus TaxID=9423 RepID=UPI001E67F7C2|nr:DNA dC->dU-editing enzyme APOBEC-3G-like [Phyllostomus hastatus]
MEPWPRPTTSTSATCERPLTGTPPTSASRWRKNSLTLLSPPTGGVFRNQPSHLHQVYPEEPLHAEQRFLSWFYDTILSARADYRVTWYMSWSPCFECAEEVVSFLGEHENVSLSISASRLYKRDDQGQQEGLRLLDQAGAEVAMMSPEDFEYCWDNFVDNRGMSFWYWKGIRRNYHALDDELKEILWTHQCALRLPVLALEGGRHSVQPKRTSERCLPGSPGPRGHPLRGLPRRPRAEPGTPSTSGPDTGSSLLFTCDLQQAAEGSPLSRKAEPALGTMAGSKLPWKEGYPPKPWPRNPMQKLHADYFNFHFTNELTPKGRNGCYICYEVRGNHSPIPLARGVFENQFYPKKRLHTEICFLNWFKESPLEKTPGPGEQYDITWYMSWSPCVECAKQVAEFLNTHKHVRLRITFSRLYHSKKQEYRQGLRSLAGAGAEVAVMSPKNIKYCWNNFVDKRRWSSWYWPDIHINYDALHKTLTEILRPRMDKDIFIENFGPQMPHETYLCYEVEQPEGDSGIPEDQLKGFLRNQGADTPEETRHAELCFLDRIRSWGLDRNEHYSITVFISWSPCPDCALSLVGFLRENSLVSLRIFAARIHSYIEGYEDGLRQLKAAVAQISIMDIPEYKRCWDTFVDHQGRPFEPGDDLCAHIRKESQMLDNILKGSGK